MGRQRQKLLYPGPTPPAPTALRALAGSVDPETMVRDRDLTQLTAGQSAGAQQVTSDFEQVTVLAGLGSARRWPSLLLGDVRKGVMFFNPLIPKLARVRIPWCPC